MAGIKKFCTIRFSLASFARALTSRVKLLALISALPLVIVYVLFCPVLRKDLYYPLLFPHADSTPTLPPRLKQVCNDVTFNSGQNHLHGWYLRNSRSRYTVLLHHGNEGNVEQWAPFLEKLYEQGFSVLLYDYGGYGRSSGSASMQGILTDGTSAFDYLVASGKATPSEVINLGTSLGSAVATHVAAHRSSKALILWSPYSSLVRTCRENLPILHMYPDCLFPETDIGCSYEIAHVPVPILILHGDNDECINFAHACELRESKPSSMLVSLTNGGHVDHHWFNRADVKRAMHDFIKILERPST